jgi:putative transposase
MDFRQSIVAELANPYLNHGERARLIREKASRTWDMAWTQKTTLTEATIKNWLELYRKQGKEGLRPKKRKDSVSARAVSPQDTQVFVDYLRENPELTARSAWNQLYSEGKVSQDISSYSLSRLVSSQGMRRQDSLMTRREGKSLKFEFFNPLECVQADCLHGMVTQHH